MIQSIVRYLIAAGLAYLVGHGVITQSIANANVAALTNYTVIALTLIGTIAWSYFEKKYKGVLAAYFPSSLGRTPPPTTLLVAILLAGGAAYVLSGCATVTSNGQTTTVIAVPSAGIQSGVTVGTSSALIAGLDLGVKQSTTRTRLANYIYTGATLATQLNNGTTVSPDDFKAYLAKYGIQNDSVYSLVASAITLVYSTLIYPHIQGGSGPGVEAYLSSFILGLQSGAAALGATTS